MSEENIVSEQSVQAAAQVAPNGCNQIKLASFSGKTASVVVNIRSGTMLGSNHVAVGLNSPIVGTLSPNTSHNFDAWVYGDSVPDYWNGQQDARWFRLTGTNNWVASALIYGGPGTPLQCF